MHVRYIRPEIKAEGAGLALRPKPGLVRRKLLLYDVCAVVHHVGCQRTVPAASQGPAHGIADDAVAVITVIKSVASGVSAVAAQVIHNGGGAEVKEIPHLRFSVHGPGLEGLPVRRVP